MKIDFESYKAANRLYQLFAIIIARDEEDLILKKYADSYLCLDDSAQ